MHVNVRSGGVGRVGVCMLCVCDSEECEEVGAGVTAQKRKAKKFRPSLPDLGADDLGDEERVTRMSKLGVKLRWLST